MRLGNLKPRRLDSQYAAEDSYADVEWMLSYEYELFRSFVTCDGRNPARRSSAAFVLASAGWEKWGKKSLRSAHIACYSLAGIS